MISESCEISIAPPADRTHTAVYSSRCSSIRCKFDKKTPIIALTAISQEDSQDNFFKAGCNDVVTKPFKPNVFYDTIKEFIELNSRLV